MSGLALAALALAACGDAAADAAGTWGERIELLPAAADPQVAEQLTHLRLADLQRAAELAGVDHTEPEGLLELTHQDRNVMVRLPEMMDPLQLASVEEYRDNIGWSPLDVDWAVELVQPPMNVAVLSGAFSITDLEAANGPSVDGSIVPETSNRLDPAAQAPGRPLGMTPRFDLEDDELLWISRGERDAREGERLSDDDRAVALVDALDAVGAYTAEVFVGRAGAFDRRALVTLGGVDDPDELEDQLLPAPFHGVAVGLLPPSDDGSPRGAAIHLHASDADAEANAEAIEQLLTTGSDPLRGGTPYDTLVDGVEVAVDGAVVTTTFVSLPEGSSVVFNLAYRSLLVVHR